MYQVYSKHTEKEITFCNKHWSSVLDIKHCFVFKKMNRCNVFIKLNQNYFVVFVIFIGLTKNKIITPNSSQSFCCHSNTKIKEAKLLIF